MRRRCRATLMCGCRCGGVGVGAVTNRLSGNRCNHDLLRNPQARGFNVKTLSSDADVWLSVWRSGGWCGYKQVVRKSMQPRSSSESSSEGVR